MHMVRKNNIAVPALRAAHEHFRKIVAQRGEVTHICYDSDLRHDERNVTQMRSEPFVWLLGNMSTHMSPFPTLVDCYLATRHDWATLETLKYAGYVLDTYRPRTLAADGIRAYVWDGDALHRAMDIDALRALVCQVARARAVSHLQNLRMQAGADMDSARAFRDERWIGQVSDRIAGIDRDIALAQEWGHV